MIFLRFKQCATARFSQSGNVLFAILIAVALLAALTVAVSRSDRGIGTMDREKATLNINKFMTFALDVKRASEQLLREGISERQLSFAHHELAGYGTPDTNARLEVFNIAGGGAAFTQVPDVVNDGSQWEFYSHTAAPGEGDANKPELMLVLPNVTGAFCKAFNDFAGLSSQPEDTGACVHDTTKRFNGTYPTSGVNILDVSEFSHSPAPYACVRCGDNHHIYYVITPR